TVVVVMACAILWSTQGERFGGIFDGVNAMIAVLAPPISTVFIWGIFWRRGTAAASLTTLIIGFVLGALVFMFDFPAMSRFVVGVDESGTAIQVVTNVWGIPFMLQAWWLFVICSVIFVSVSLITLPPSAERLERYCWGNPLAVIFGQPFEGIGDPRALSVLLMAVIAICYAFFL
ncbi:MAG: sodium:glucose symporter, partial [Planctomycetes bacterium]|nr:sodium:glucose symporter [Planctomycetota bacterium]